MNIPNELAYALIPILGGSAVWSARQFVLSVMRRKEPVAATPVELSVRNLAEVTAIIEKQFNGRYLQTATAFDEFDAMHRSLHEIRNLLCQPLVMLLEKDHPQMAKQLTDTLNRKQGERYDRTKGGPQNH